MKLIVSIFPREQGFHLFAFFIEYTSAFVIVHQDAAALKRGKQRGVQRVPKGGVFDVHIRVRRERTRLRPAVGVDVEETTSSRHAATGALLVAGEGYVDHLRMFLP